MLPGYVLCPVCLLCTTSCSCSNIFSCCISTLSSLAETFLLRCCDSYFVVHLPSVSDVITPFSRSMSSLCSAHTHTLSIAVSPSLLQPFSVTGLMEDCPFLFHPLMPALFFFFPFLPSKRSTEHYNQPCTYCSFPVLLAVLHKKRFPKPNTTYLSHLLHHN